jgi:uncharacterized protein (TIGR04222 family)
MQSPQQDPLWQRLLDYRIGPVNAELSFTARLARENGWSAAFAERVLVEYKKFCYLAVRSGHSVTPSHAVDQAWHLHLSYTRDYWQRFCTDVIAQPLHHGPTEGGIAQAQLYCLHYEKTLEALDKHFGASDADIWPSARDRFAHAEDWRMVNTSQTYLLPKLQFHRHVLRRYIRRAAFTLGAMLIAGSASALEFAPLTAWDGGEFLLLFVALMPLCWMVNVVQRATQSRSPGNGRMLTPVEAAMLQHGYERAVQTAEVELIQDGVLAIVEGKLSDTGKPSSMRTQSLIHEDAMRLAPDRARKARVVDAYRLELISKGLHLRAEETRAMRFSLAMPWLLLLAFGAVRIGLAITWQKPFILLLLLMLFSIVLMILSIVKVSRAAGHAFSQLRAMRRRADLRHVRLPGQYALACALFGAGVLAGTSLDGYAHLRAASGSGCGSSGCSGGSGGDGGGSGCGGCGGD